MSSAVAAGSPALPPLAVVRSPSMDAATGLVAPPTAFVGREGEAAGVVALLRRPEGRIVTLTGPGGIGKTRLAVHLIDLVAGEYATAAGVALAPLSDAALVVPAIADALGVRQTADCSLHDAVIETLHEGTTLLLRDNCEHIVAAAPELARLLIACPDLTILATSREALRISGEREFPVPPLGLTARGRGGEGGSNLPSPSPPLPLRLGCRPPLRRAGASRPAGFCVDGGERPRRRRGLSAVGRVAVGDRVGRRPDENPLAGGAAGAVGPASNDPDPRRPRSAGPSADDARCDRLELRPALN